MSYWIGDEVVNATIIGDFAGWPYQFWTTKVGPYPLCLPVHKFAEKWFLNDDDAEQWVKEHYPKHYAEGIEMRCFDQGG